MLLNVFYFVVMLRSPGRNRGSWSATSCAACPQAIGVPLARSFRISNRPPEGRYWGTHSGAPITKWMEFCVTPRRHSAKVSTA